MSHPAPSLKEDFLPLAQRAGTGTDVYLNAARMRVLDRVTVQDRLSGDLLEQHQHMTHGLAWLATCAEAVAELLAWAERLEDQGRLGALEELILQVGVAEYTAQIMGGIPMSQTEFVRPSDFGIDLAALLDAPTRAAMTAVTAWNTPEARAALTRHLLAGSGDLCGDPALDETLEAMRQAMRQFCLEEVCPHAHDWHLNNAYIPMGTVEKMAELGVFGLTIPEEFGGLGLGKEAMCVVSEELSRAYIGIGSLGTRSEIAAELIHLAGTPEQKAQWLPRLASGEILPTAVFTEPDTGSDLASLKTRAVRDGEVWKVTGSKTWITHPVRADLMTLLVRTNPYETGYRGLSMLLATKPRGTDDDPFPAQGMSGGEIEVLGYRGMKEYEIAFDEFEVAENQLLGGVEGEGFKQLMQTFEAARIQTAARAVGVAQSALDLALKYAQERIQFGKPLIAFPRVSDKIALMAVEVMMARQITHFAAKAKDEGRRCDLEAGMAKLLAARVAWAAADNALQIHGGNGFALEYPVSRILCDARILNIFEGAAEIQAQVIARRLLEGSA